MKEGMLPAEWRGGVDLGESPFAFSIERPSGESIALFAFREGTFDQQLEDSISAWLWRQTTLRLANSKEE